MVQTRIELQVARQKALKFARTLKDELQRRPDAEFHRRIQPVHDHLESKGGELAGRRVEFGGADVISFRQVLRKGLMCQPASQFVLSILFR